MPETQFPSVIQRMIYCQIGSGICLFGSDPAAPGGRSRKLTIIHISVPQNLKAEAVKK